jgi:hypothetical protein
MKQPHPRPDIQRLLERRARHGLTFREISEESGIPIPTLSYWASKQRREGGAGEPVAQFVPVAIEGDDQAGTIAIELGAAVRVTVERGFDEEHLSRVLSVLARC